MIALSDKTKMTEIPVKKTIGIQVLIADDPSLLRDRSWESEVGRTFGLRTSGFRLIRYPIC
jgi:hypothetical protein